MAQGSSSSRLSGLWRSLTPSQRLMVGGTVAAIVIAIIVGGLVVRRSGYSTLYSGLAPEEAGQVIEKLDQRNIPYRLAGGGTTILVPTGRVYATRIELASEGLPRSCTVGFEIFDKTVFGMTEFLQKVNYRRALEGELAKTIGQMEEVEGVRVHIVVPERTLFSEDDQPATASVVIRTNPARKLSRRHIEGIAYLVASGVEGLEPDRVTILDSRGTLLSRGFSNGEGQPTESLEVKKSVESYLEDKAQTLLDGVLGPGKSVVRIAAILNMERIETSVERFNPESAVIRSEERIENTEVDGVGRSESAVTNYEFDRTVESIAGEIGNIDRLSVAVMVDGTYETGAEGVSAPTKRFVPRSDDELGKISGIVKSAVGFDLRRNDYFEIACIAFDRSFLEEEEQGLERMLKMQFYFSIARKAAYLAAGFLALILILKLVKRTAAIIGAAARTGIDVSVGKGPEIANAGVVPTAPKGVSDVAMQIANLASRNPDQAAGVISSMVKQEE